MDRQIPIYFDTIIVDTPVQEIPYEDSNAFRLQVGVFTKYRNRNGSYITDEYAEYLISSATRGNTPVVGFFDPETQKWSSHTGPTLANGYGYVESFVGWQPFTDTDGVAREYAVFSVVLFTQYYEEAKKIRGQHQSMELNPDTITGEWASFEDGEYFVYKTGDMLGFCVIGEHEPCFSVSTFFSKNDDTYKSQYEKFSSLLQNLKQQVEETEIKLKGGEQPMDELNKEQVAVETPEAVEPEAAPAPEFEVENSEVEVAAEEPAVEETPAVDEPAPEAKPEAEAEVEVAAEPSEFDMLQQRFEELQNSYNELQTRFNETVETFNNLNSQLEAIRAENTNLQARVANYEAIEAQNEANRKSNLIEKYEKVLNEEEINPIKNAANDFSYDELEGKLAVIFANKQMAGSDESKKVPLPEPEVVNEFALLMSKYHR